VCSGGRLRRPCLNCGFDPHRIRCEGPASDATTVGSGSVEDQRLAPGAAGLHVAAGLPLLRPEEQVFAAMLDGWGSQQLARNLAPGTVEGRQRAVRAFAVHAGAWPWAWTPQMVDEWCTDLRTVRRLRRSTLRSYQLAVRLFCAYLTDPAYDWPAQCQRRFGTHPVQVVHEWNAAVHAQQAEADPLKRAFTVEELQAFFDYADAQVARIRAAGRKGSPARLPGRGGVQGRLRRRAAPQRGAHAGHRRLRPATPTGWSSPGYGVCYVRYGKATMGSAPKPRGVLTFWAWVPDVLGEWTSQFRPLLAPAGSPALWPSERAARVGLQRINSRFAAYRDALGLPGGLDFHSLRRSYVTHRIEAGWDARFVQEQAGHQHASTTSIDTCVSADFRTRTLRRALDQTVQAALARRAR
jgi:integrase/recombinase XerC